MTTPEPTPPLTDDGPTPSLVEYRRQAAEDPNVFWRLSSGDHLNLLGEAIEEVDQITAHNGVLVTEVKFQGERAEEYKAEVDRLRAELDALLPIASPHRTTKADRERNWLHGAWESFAARAKPARAAANRWAREADRLEEWSRKRQAEAESGAWPYKNCCYEHEGPRESATTPPEGDTDE